MAGLKPTRVTVGRDKDAGGKCWREKRWQDGPGLLVCGSRQADERKVVCKVVVCKQDT